MSRFAIGTLVKARGREWVVLPESQDDLVMLRPLAGVAEEVTGIVPDLEPIEPAVFAPPDPAHTGDHRSCGLLRDAVRLGVRNSAGPFRSFGSIAVTPRPYQLVPLLVALKQPKARVLIADDVGVGKTVEACLIAAELLARGEARRLAVLCPPHLAEQWQRELSAKFHIDAKLVLASTVARLERECAADQSIFEVHDHLVISIDFIKSNRYRADFLRTCPELVIVDEAHTCTRDAEARGSRHQRHELLADLAKSPDRHMVLVTATPHSGNEAAFRSLVALLDPALADLPEDLSGPAHEADRRRLAGHFIQRRRADIEAYLDAQTPFPNREVHKDLTYSLSAPYKALFDDCLDFARELVAVRGEDKRRQRVRWWSAIALLRSLSSSPAAAAATLGNRARGVGAATAEEADELGRAAATDADPENADEADDASAGAEIDDSPAPTDRRRLQALAKRAAELEGDADAKLAALVKLLKDMLKRKRAPIVFCRYIATANYVAASLRERLAVKGLEIDCVTGSLPPAEREERVEKLAAFDKRLLVATDCLSEGINLQESFDAVVHYDLAWNPTRHEQREGRVDRYGQRQPTVEIAFLYGADNGIDGIVLDILINKHRSIQKTLGVSVPVPINTEKVVEAIFEGLLLRGGDATATKAVQKLLPEVEEYLKPTTAALHAEWDREAERSKRTRTMFAQEAIRTDVAASWIDACQSIGRTVDVERFVTRAVETLGGVVKPVEKAGGRPLLAIDLAGTDPAFRAGLPEGLPDRFDAVFELPHVEKTILLARTHPVVEALASHLVGTAIDDPASAKAARSGAIRTKAVAKRTTLLLVRLRFHILRSVGGDTRELLAEECCIVGFEGAAEQAAWLAPEQAEALLTATPDANIAPEQSREFVGKVVVAAPVLTPWLDAFAAERAKALLAVHRQLRDESRTKGLKEDVRPQLPADVLGVYVLLPAGS
jgi:superfamily II DNA or RNA helicase